MKNIAVISARSGSKGLPDKNIKVLNGKPLMAYSIQEALKSDCFDTVMVSTDSEKYAEIARQYGAQVPFLRSSETSSDKASSWDAVEEVLQGYEKMGQSYDTFCLLQPTSPLRLAKDIKEAYNLYTKKEAIAILSMTQLEHPIEWCGKIDESLSLNGFYKDEKGYLAAVYLHNCLKENVSVDRLWRNEEIHKGVVQYLRYIGNESTWGNDGTVSQMLEPYRGIEIDDEDWFVHNVLNCWLPVGDGERDLSRLDLRTISLAEHLKTRFNGTINIDEAKISKETLLNDKHHDRIIAIAFSHDGKTMAAVSENGIVSVTNIITQSQMIVGIIGEIGKIEDCAIGFNLEDYLFIKFGYTTYKWPTINYDRIEYGNYDEVVELKSQSQEIEEKVESLKSRLKASRMYGCCEKASEDGKYLAVGFDSGFIQIWDVETQNEVANLSLSDSQIVTVSFTSDGSIAALGSGGNLVQLWNIKKQSYIRTLYFENRVSQVRFPAEEKYLECQFSDGRYCRVDISNGNIDEELKYDGIAFLSKKLLNRVDVGKYSVIDSEPHGNAILLSHDGKAYTWDEKKKRLNECPGHMSKVTAVAICKADNRFAASFSPENYVSDRDDGYRRVQLDGQKLVRVRIVSTGQCQWRLPTHGRVIRKLQFFTMNRIVLAGLATNGDILLWELHNKWVHGQEHGRWDELQIVLNNQAEPIECAVPLEKDKFISAYNDGTILIRSFQKRSGTRIQTLPGIDAGVFRWNDLDCDSELKKAMRRYLPRAE